MKTQETKTADAVTIQEIAEARRLLRAGLEKSVKDEAEIWGSPFLIAGALDALRALGIDVRNYRHMDTVAK